MRIEPTPWEVSVLRRMDVATRIILAEKKGAAQVSGSVEDASDAESIKAMFRMMGAKAA